MSDDGWRARIRWVVVHPDLPEVLLARRDGGLALPEAERPGQVWIGDPGEVMAPLRELLGGDAVMLRCLEEIQDPSTRTQRATVLAAARTPAAPPEGTAWLDRAELTADAAGLDGADPGLALAARVAADLEDGRPPAGLQPWAARGWHAQAEDWLAAEMERLGRPLTGPVEQVRVWELSCVLRAPTTAGDVWFKTSIAAPLFVNEGVVMRALARLFPDNVPAPLAVDPERGWMVLAGFDAKLGWDAPLEVVEAVARTFAGMQAEAAGHVDLLLAAGCNDRRLDRLAARAEAWLPEVGADGRLPAMDTATWLSEEEAAALAAAVPRIRACCEELAALAVPASLVHGDLHLANVAEGPRGPLLFDWTDACVTHPFLDLATIRRGTGEIDVAEAELRARLRAAYLPAWSSFESPERLARAWELAVPLGALHQAVSYRSLVASLQPPIDLHMARSTAWWLRQVLAELP
ncbi:MAG TPA: phosphotransferase [Actinomycetota bacterium]